MKRYLVTIDATEYTIDIDYHSERYNVMVNGKPFECDVSRLGDSRSLILLNNLSYEVDVHSSGYESRKIAFMRGVEIPADVEDYNLAQMRKAAGVKIGEKTERILKAQMPGLVVKLHVSQGDSVVKGQPLFVVEAMKMENVIKAQSDGVVKTVHIKNGISIEKGDKLLEFA
jgi:biotin carboxyl carrier protein